MTEEKRGFLMLEEVPSSIVAQAVAAFFSPFMMNTPRAMLIDALRKAPCVLIENVPMDVGDAFAKKLNDLGAKVTFCASNAKARPLCSDKG
jgi:hypothetical protein